MMIRLSRVTRVVSGSALVLGTQSLVNAASSTFKFDGTSSDMAQQFRNLYDAGVDASALSLSSVPGDIKARLDGHSLVFADLAPLLQRAVLWDSGYVALYGDDTTLSTIYTTCTSEMTMADLAVSLANYEKAGCLARNCIDPADNSSTTYRSQYCTGTQMSSASVCASSAAVTQTHSSMWATGGSDDLLPVPNVVRHIWNSSNNDTTYIIHAIHMVTPEHTYESCPTGTTDSAMIIPCVPYDDASTTTIWCRPSSGKVVNSWLEETASSSSNSSSSSTPSTTSTTPTTSTGKSPLSATNYRLAPSLGSVLQGFVDSAATYDGSISDLALQYLVRYAAGDLIDQQDYTELPKAVQDRLDAVGLQFKDLDGLLQRALIWDTGYVRSAAESNKLIKIHTKSGSTMADIALPLDEYLTKCTVTTCTDQNGGIFNRSEQCNGDQMNSMAHCASEDVKDTQLHLSMWADGGISTDIPDPEVVRHNWKDDFTNISYLVFAIHTGSSKNEPAWNECTASENYYGSLIVPCRPYDWINSTDRSNWDSPHTSALVAAWLQDAQESKSSFKWWYILLIVLAVLVAIAIAVFWWWRKRRQASSTYQHQGQEMQVPSPNSNGDVSAMNYNYTGLKSYGDSEYVPSDYRGTTNGSSTSNGQRGSASDAIRFLEEDAVLMRSRIPLDELQLTRVLAKGGFGEIWMGHHQLTQVVIKKLLAGKQQFDTVQGFIEEIKLTASFNHPNVIRFVGVAWSKLENISMVIEYLEKGDLQAFLESNNQTMTWNMEKYPIALGVASAISYLHARCPAPLIHRDIKAKNILLTETLQPKLIDFGISRDRVQETMTAGIGTPYWAAPEVLEGNRYTEQSDIYSFGILLSELDTGDTPFGNVRSTSGDRLSAFQILNLVLSGKLEPELSPQCPQTITAIIQDCLRLDPMRRPTALQLVERLHSIVFSSQSIGPPPAYSSYAGSTFSGGSYGATF